jgi:hypothetical protein
MVLTPPSGEITVKPVPDYLRNSAPIGQLFPASNDGTRPATFAYRGLPERFHRVVAESLTMHETIPGHYLQLAMLAQEQAAPLHPITRIVMVEGSREGWATYAEGWAAELGLYSSAFDEMGSYVNSVTPSAVADLGMQIEGWSVEQAAAYLHEEWPFDKDGQARGWAANLASSPVDGVETYPIDQDARQAPSFRAYMDAPTLPSVQGLDGADRYRLHPYIRTFARDCLAVPDGFRWSAPYRGNALEVLALKRVLPTTV